MQLGRYQILKQLATGSVADVLLARASGLEGFARHVVIKRIRPDMAAEERFAKAFLDEARIAGSLHHQNIVTVHDIGEQDGSYFFAMEYVHGEDARRLIGKVRERGENVPLEHALSIVMAAAAGLHYAHEQASGGEKLGLVHRDISPANILIGYDGSVKIVDFGMAKAVARSNTTSTGILKGKASYMSPEQCTGKPIDRRTDIFCLGIVLFELITAQRLFKGVNEFMTMASIVEGQIPKPSSLRREIPPALDEIILRALERAPESRYQTAEAFRESLEAFALAQELRTSHKALSDYLTGLFGHRPEPWEAHASKEPAAPVIDDENTYAKGLVAAPSAGRDELLARMSPRAASPMALAEADAGEWDDDDENVRTAAAGGPNLVIRNRTSARAASESHLRTTPSPTLKAPHDEPTQTKTDAGPAPDDTTQLPLAGDTTQLPLAGDTTTMGLAADTATLGLSAATPTPVAVAPAPRRPRATDGDEIDNRTVVEPPIFGGKTSAGDDDDEFENEAATEIAADDEAPWKEHQDPAATIPPPTRAGAVRKPAVVPRASLPAQRPTPPPPAPSPAPPPVAAAEGRLPLPPRPSASRPAMSGAADGPTRPAIGGPSDGPTRPAMLGPSDGASGPATLAGTGAPPPSMPIPSAATPGAGATAASAPGSVPPPLSPAGFGVAQGGYPAAPPGSSPGLVLPPGTASPYGMPAAGADALRSPLQLFIMKHATRLWIAGGVALILLVIIAARGCGDSHPRAGSHESSDLDRSGPDK